MNKLIFTIPLVLFLYGCSTNQEKLIAIEELTDKVVMHSENIVCKRLSVRALFTRYGHMMDQWLAFCYPHNKDMFTEQ